jgi:hypothetical protein
MVMSLSLLLIESSIIHTALRLEGKLSNEINAEYSDFSLEKWLKHMAENGSILLIIDTEL